ncbi:maleylpyruvate isomerase [Frankia sp. AiPs1]|uniref:maleylpyruvate isomerase N-terminal domain-containing protein n=1 Tax=Frankia sp. AiPa1 TaxID=573492 RepID=UPI00202B2558|nr:maleylpyruvate isomerase N-terminal domain-containing protein [Frankia sp. AiPa1]MCL9759073.1 maleylpyruvate isomerase N-terminal domain-containing protein [Frankia sp. AiPa1]
MAAPTSSRSGRYPDDRPPPPPDLSPSAVRSDSAAPADFSLRSEPADRSDPDSGPVQESGVAAALAAAGPVSVGSDYRPSTIPHDLLAGVTAAHGRLADVLAGVDDDTLRRPSELPGWSVAHLLTHIARNAEAHLGMVQAASVGEVRDMYPGGQAQRDGDIEAGRDVPAATARAAITDAMARLEQAWDAVPVDVWRTGLGRVIAYGPTSLADLVFLRWREAEIHLVDLGLADHDGPRWADLDAAYVDVEWAWTVRGLSERVPPEYTVLLAPGDRPSTAAGRGDRLVVVDVPALDALAWLTGRQPGADGWPPLGPWK